MNSFDTAMAFVLASEGGYVFDPRDNGGETNLGVTDKQDGKVDRLIDVNGDGTLMVPVKDLTIDQAKVVYRRNYWTPTHCDELSPGRALIIVDTAVNMGVHQAIKLIQRVGGLTEDGCFGPHTLAAAKVLDIEAYGAARLAIYKQLSGWATYGHGWSIRVTKVISTAKGLEG